MNIKKTIYILLTIFLGVLLSFMAHALIEILFLNSLSAKGAIPVANDFLGKNCYLPVYLQFGLLALGIVGGYFLGRTWWRIIYIEHRRWKNKK